MCRGDRGRPCVLNPLSNGNLPNSATREALVVLPSAFSSNACFDFLECSNRFDSPEGKDMIESRADGAVSAMDRFVYSYFSACFASSFRARPFQGLESLTMRLHIFTWAHFSESNSFTLFTLCSRYSLGVGPGMSMPLPQVDVGMSVRQVPPVRNLGGSCWMLWKVLMFSSSRIRNLSSSISRFFLFVQRWICSSGVRWSNENWRSACGLRLRMRMRAICVCACCALIYSFWTHTEDARNWGRPLKAAVGMASSRGCPGSSHGWGSLLGTANCSARSTRSAAAGSRVRFRRESARYGGAQRKALASFGPRNPRRGLGPGLALPDSRAGNGTGTCGSRLQRPRQRFGVRQSKRRH